MTFLTTAEALFQYSEWLDSEGLIISDKLGDDRTHEELVREFLKPDEPTGLGAVVEDAAGCHWVRFSSKTGDWWRNHQGENRRWVDIRADRVLNRGFEE